MTGSCFKRRIIFPFSFIENKLLVGWNAEMHHRQLEIFTLQGNDIVFRLLALSHRASYLSLSWLMAIYAIHDHWEGRRLLFQNAPRQSSVMDMIMLKGRKLRGFKVMVSPSLLGYHHLLWSYHLSFKKCFWKGFGDLPLEKSGRGVRSNKVELI